MKRFFLKIYDLLSKHIVLRWILLAILFLFIVIGMSRISLDEDITGFMPDGAENERLNFVYNNVGVADKIIIRFSLKDQDIDPEQGVYRLMDCVDDFILILDSLNVKEHLDDILYRVDSEQILSLSSFLTDNIPYYLTQADYDSLDVILSENRIPGTLQANRRVLLSPMGSVIKHNIINDPLHLSANILSSLQKFQISDQYKVVDDYIFSYDGRDILLFLTSAYSTGETAKNTKLAKLLNEATERVSDDFNTDIFGSALIGVANAQRIKKDSIISLLLAFVLMFFVLGRFFKSARALFFILLPVITGAGLAIFLMFVIKGSMSAIAIGIGAIILGIAVNYSMHYLIHFKHQPDAKKTLKEIITPMLIGNITTVGSFLSLLFISAPAMRDFGLFAAFSLVCTILFVLIFLPHFVNNKKPLFKQKRSWIDSLSEYRFEENRWFLLFILLFTIIFLFFAPDISFETNMQKINYMTDEQREDFEQLSNITTLGEKSVFDLSEGKTLNDALKASERRSVLIDSLISENMIKSVVGIGDLLPSDSLQALRLAMWNQYWRDNGDQIKQTLLREGEKTGFTRDAFEGFFNTIDRQYQIVSPEYFSILTDNILKEYIISTDQRNMVFSILYIDNSLSAEVEEILSGQPDALIFDTGSITRSLVSSLADDFNYVLYICALLVFAFLIVAFGRVELSMIAFLPMFLSWIWILGIMGIFDIKFNIVNIILATFIFGLGDDYTIFIMDGLVYEYTYRKKMLSSHKTAVTLSALTMFIGIGALIFARHPAMKSLGEITVIGMSSVVLITYIIPPFLFRWLTTKRGRQRSVPITIKNLFITVVAFIAFLIGSFLITIAGFFILGLGNKSEKRKERYHKLLCNTFRWMAKSIPGVSLNVTDNGEDFSKPGVIICNHQAHLDLMYLLMLSPKIIVLTNEWVWNSPFYGRIVKYADFYPVADGVEKSVDVLRKAVEQGYSIAIFPEGTRSEECDIKRFHKGAFYLAEQLNLDIIPILLHGVGHVLPKRELLLRNGGVSIKILDRIAPDDLKYGDNYSQRARSIRKYFCQQYDALIKDIETPLYFRELVRYNYVYKGVGVERASRQQLRRIDHYAEIISSIEENAHITLLNCGIGVFPLLCALSRKDVTVTAYDKQADNIALASALNSKPDNLTFVLDEGYNISTSNPIIDLEKV